MTDSDRLDCDTLHLIVRERDGYLLQRAIDVEQWHVLRLRVLVGHKHGGLLKGMAKGKIDAGMAGASSRRNN